MSVNPALSRSGCGLSTLKSDCSNAYRSSGSSTVKFNSSMVYVVPAAKYGAAQPITSITAHNRDRIRLLMSVPPSTGWFPGLFSGLPPIIQQFLFQIPIESGRRSLLTPVLTVRNKSLRCFSWLSRASHGILWGSAPNPAAFEKAGETFLFCPLAARHFPFLNNP